ncbi:DUF456 domain-containing protein [Flavobacterium psychrophilum]|uniref:DUF456 domain-containing protein n=1 Tax=Flavobacterium psychrophilum TaxID=96345 RepID=UPI00106AC289|nr:DUF456 domain-containing protein [Flavobacterium psychrophilum]
MDIVLLIVGFICVVIGLLGSFLPVLPGPSISWVGLFLLYFTKAVANDYWVLGFTLVLTIVVLVLDYMIPSKGTRKFGGSSYGVWGTNIGLAFGFFFIPIPFGFVIGAFAGAFLGEIFYNLKDKKRALMIATGSLLGFLASAFIKFILCMLFLGIFVYVAWQNYGRLFG